MAKAVDLVKSREIRDKVSARDKECFHNALNGTMVLAKFDKVFYVEGFVVDEKFGIVMEHGWIELGDSIIDPTPTYCGDERATHYFAGKLYTPSEVRRRIMRRGNVTLPFYGLWGRDEEMRAAYAKAGRFTYGDETFERLHGNHPELSSKETTRADGN